MMPPAGSTGERERAKDGWQNQEHKGGKEGSKGGSGMPSGDPDVRSVRARFDPWFLLWIRPFSESVTVRTRASVGTSTSSGEQGHSTAEVDEGVSRKGGAAVAAGMGRGWRWISGCMHGCPYM